MPVTDPLHPSVCAAFHAFSARFEGVVHKMYVDYLGYVTTGIGNLIDPLSLALGTPFRRPDGELASPAEIEAEWRRVKGDPDAARLGHRHTDTYTRLSLRDDDLAMLVTWRRDEMAKQLARHFPAMPDWPASAQLAAMSMAWAMGPGFPATFLRFAVAADAQDFAAAATECTIREAGNPGVVPRNKANRKLLLAAAHVVETNGDRSVLLMEPPAGLTGAERQRTLGLVDLTARASIEEGLAEDRRQFGGDR